MSERSKPGLEENFRELLNLNGPALSRLAASYTASASERDDLLQEIAIAIWQAPPHFRGESSERTFIFRIAQNRAISYLAQQQPSSRSMDDSWELPDRQPSPEERLSRHQESVRLLAAIQRLPVQYRQVITLALEDLNYADTAEILGISESNVGVCLTRARQLLRQILEVSK